MTNLNFGTSGTMGEISGMKCTVCRKPKHTLRPRMSKLKPDMQMMLCAECFDEKREPRYLIVLIARDRRNGGLAAVRDYIRQHRYYGDKITAEEITP